MRQGIVRASTFALRASCMFALAVHFSVVVLVSLSVVETSRISKISAADTLGGSAPAPSNGNGGGLSHSLRWTRLFPAFSLVHVAVGGGSQIPRLALHLPQTTAMMQDVVHWVDDADDDETTIVPATAARGKKDGRRRLNGPAESSSSASAAIDVVIVGAGMSGIAAAKTLERGNGRRKDTSEHSFSEFSSSPLSTILHTEWSALLMGASPSSARAPTHRPLTVTKGPNAALPELLPLYTFRPQRHSIWKSGTELNSGRDPCWERRRAADGIASSPSNFTARSIEFVPSFSPLYSTLFSIFVNHFGTNAQSCGAVSGAEGMVNASLFLAMSVIDLPALGDTAAGSRILLVRGLLSAVELYLGSVLPYSVDWLTRVLYPSLRDIGDYGSWWSWFGAFCSWSSVSVPASDFASALDWGQPLGGVDSELPMLFLAPPLTPSSTSVASSSVGGAPLPSPPAIMMGYRVLVLEGRDRIGGRIQSVRVEGNIGGDGTADAGEGEAKGRNRRGDERRVADLGATFIHFRQQTAVVMNRSGDAAGPSSSVAASDESTATEGPAEVVIAESNPVLDVAQSLLGYQAAKALTPVNYSRCRYVGRTGETIPLATSLALRDLFVEAAYDEVFEGIRLDLDETVRQFLTRQMEEMTAEHQPSPLSDSVGALLDPPLSESLLDSMLQTVSDRLARANVSSALPPPGQSSLLFGNAGNAALDAMVLGDLIAAIHLQQQQNVTTVTENESNIHPFNSKQPHHLSSQVLDQLALYFYQHTVQDLQAAPLNCSSLLYDSDAAMGPLQARDVVPQGGMSALLDCLLDANEGGAGGGSAMRDSIVLNAAVNAVRYPCGHCSFGRDVADFIAAAATVASTNQSLSAKTAATTAIPPVVPQAATPVSAVADRFVMVLYEALSLQQDALNMTYYASAEEEEGEGEWEAAGDGEDAAGQGREWGGAIGLFYSSVSTGAHSLWLRSFGFVRRRLFLAVTKAQQWLSGGSMALLDAAWAATVNSTRLLEHIASGIYTTMGAFGGGGADVGEADGYADYPVGYVRLTVGSATALDGDSTATEDIHYVHARKVILTLPVGVLQHSLLRDADAQGKKQEGSRKAKRKSQHAKDLITFSPPLPEAYYDTLLELMGVTVPLKVVLCFESSALAAWFNNRFGYEEGVDVRSQHDAPYRTVPSFFVAGNTTMAEWNGSSTAPPSPPLGFDFGDAADHVEFINLAAVGGGQGDGCLVAGMDGPSAEKARRRATGSGHSEDLSSDGVVDDGAVPAEMLRYLVGRLSSILPPASPLSSSPPPPLPEIVSAVASRWEEPFSRGGYAHRRPLPYTVADATMLHTTIGGSDGGRGFEVPHSRGDEETPKKGGGSPSSSSSREQHDGQRGDAMARHLRTMAKDSPVFQQHFIDRKVALAGEHTSWGSYGNIQGAYESGVCAARDAVELLVAEDLLFALLQIVMHVGVWCALLAVVWSVIGVFLTFF